MAVVLGLAASAISKKMPGLKNGIITLDKAFSLITSKLMILMPLVVFCAMAKMMVSMDTGSLGSVLVWLPVNGFGYVLMIGVYLILLLILARLNPIRFLKKWYKAMITAFTLSSSNAALPTSAKKCEEFGVSNIFGGEINVGMLLSLFISIMVMSVGTPGVPGGSLICFTLLLPQIGVPAEAVSIIIGIYPIASMMVTAVNVTGDAVVTSIVAKSERLLDMGKYNS